MPFQIVRNDITKMQVDAIVNTANPLPTYGSGIDTAVYEAAGKSELLALREKIGEAMPGTSFVTEGLSLPAKAIIHTVGCPWQGGGKGEEQILRSCYQSVFALALEQGFESLAIPLLASGSYGFPKGIALRIALSEIEAFMADHDLSLFLVVFDEKSFSLSAELYGDIDTYINDHYVEEKVKEEYFGGAMGAASMSAPMKSAFAKPRLFSAALRDEAFVISGKQAGEARSLDDVIQNLDKSFMELVFSFADEKGLTDVQVQKRANLDRKAFSKLKCGTTKNPSKSTALALSVALQLSLDETKDLLSRAGLALSPCSRQDLIVQYFIERQAYDIYEINLALFEHGEPLLGSIGSL